MNTHIPLVVDKCVLVMFSLWQGVV